MRSKLTALVLSVAAGFLCPAGTASAAVELSSVVGFRMGGAFDIENRADRRQDQLELQDGVSHGLVLNVDLDERGKQAELYVSRHETTATASIPLLGDRSAIDLVIYQLQFGGLYFPGGTTTGGFVSGVAGVARLDPTANGLDAHHRVSLSLGGGYKLRLARNLLVRADLRGIFTALDSGGAVFCSGGCSVRFQSDGYFQAEASAGLVLRF